ncbi:MAG: polysaccharide biosynthesis protein [Gammaproteobacteria bacterium]|nr:polysaccharide biosynthesis protein [Gammaproteobacteria bacterium]MBU0788332.1 polysaccharide biosynthesis protein [Gammaproteobacteria bacterium]MBU0815171.1 polysaccharide biosynthesis protein [Gammaproteobacteria bacterium]MBU1785721.1 polysaccharide biosynthesis protein [Gammaproteobacteria bacterium]
MQHRVIAWPRSVKRAIVVALDVVMALAATWVAFTLRLDTLHSPVGAQWWVYVLTPVLAIPVFVKFGLYRAIFRYTGQAALVATTQAVLVYGALLLGVLLWRQWPGVPRSLGILQPLIFLLMVGASRAMARFWLANVGSKTKNASGRLLIFGAGDAGVQTATAISSTGQYVLQGFIDDDPSKVGRSINGVPVFSPADVPDMVEKYGVTDILLALPSASRGRRNRIIQDLQSLPIHIRTLPGLADLASGRVTVKDFRELDVEDLLGRDPVPPDPELLTRDLTGQVVMVTGAGGSIGGELCRQIVEQRPRQLILLDHNEFGLYSIHCELQGLCNSQDLAVELLPLLGRVTYYPRMTAICQMYRPSIVYHAAAYKHVPMVESNAGEGIANNVFGTLNMARAAMENRVGRFVLISTDKAVRPTNVMGASKRMAEMVLQAMAAEAVLQFSGDLVEKPGMVKNQTCFTMVRFGNVLDSSGSVVPLFRKQLADGGPLTVTHAEVTRYFMTIPEAAQLVLQAGAMASGGDVFVLDMGEPVKILDLARRMVQLSGLSVRDEDHPDGDISIDIVGLRPGEKLYEELLIGENPQPTSHPRIMKAHEQYLAWSELSAELTKLGSVAQQNDLAAIKDFLRQHVQGYQAKEAAPMS